MILHSTEYALWDIRPCRRHIRLIFIPQVPIYSAIFVMSLITSKSVCPRAVTGSRPVGQSRKPSSGCPVIEYQTLDTYEAIFFVRFLVVLIPTLST